MRLSRLLRPADSGEPQGPPRALVPVVSAIWGPAASERIGGYARPPQRGSWARVGDKPEPTRRRPPGSRTIGCDRAQLHRPSPRLPHGRRFLATRQFRRRLSSIPSAATPACADACRSSSSRFSIARHVSRTFSAIASDASVRCGSTSWHASSNASSRAFSSTPGRVASPAGYKPAQPTLKITTIRFYRRLSRQESRTGLSGG
jgi:hypothetical protein